MTATVGEIAVPRAVEGHFTRDDARCLVELRRDLHRHPELSWKETETSDKLLAALTSLGVTDVVRVAGTGLVARIPVRDRLAPVVAVRGDIDALPIPCSP